MIKKHIVESIEAIDKVTSLFYQNKTDEGYKELENVLNILSIMISKSSEEKQKGIDIFIDDIKLNEVLIEAMKALEAGDTILFSDIFEYELKGLLTQAV